jgi:2-C-methyl-D-erythritol 4-phosphate cytidylyltransferase
MSPDPPVANPGTFGAIIVAAGSGIRMEGLDKLFTVVAGRPLLAHTIAAFQDCWNIDSIVVVVAPANVERVESMAADQGFGKVAGVCGGGHRRQDSVKCGLRTLGYVDWVAVHDGGRPLLRPGMIARGLEAARETGASVPVMPIMDTVKQVGDTGFVEGTLDRARLRLAQTPQVFRHDILTRAHEEITEDVTDDAAMVEMLGISVRAYEGRRRNIKITTPDDLWLAEAYLH